MPTCLECNGTRWHYVPASDTVTRCLACAPPLDERLAAAGVPALYIGARLATVAAQCAATAAAIDAWLARDDQLLLYLYGANGRGKTHLAAAAMAAALQRGQSARMVDARQWLAELRAVYQAHDRGADGESELAVSQRYRRPSLLVLNELPRERVSRAVAEAAEALIDSRMTALLKTLITSNLPARSVADVYSMALASRLGPKHAMVVHLGGDDLRQTGEMA